MKKNQKMNTKNILVSFLAVMSVLFLAATVSALSWSGDLVKPQATNPDALTVKVDDVLVNGEQISVIAGETIPVKVWFTSNVYDTDVTVDAEIEGEKVNVDSRTSVFDVEKDNRYTRSITIQVPYELKDKLSDEITLQLEINGKDHDTRIEDITLKVQRPSYNPAIKSISADQTVNAGETLPVDVVIKNIGYNDLSDVYVTAKITELGIQKSGYFGDLVALECDDHSDNQFPWKETTLNRKCNTDDVDTVAGRLFLSVPYDVKPGIYNLEVTVANDDTTSKKSIQINVNNEFEKTVFKSGNSLWIVNPTNNVVGYRVVPESPASVNENIVFVPAGGSKEVEVSPNTNGEYSFDVKVFTTDGQLVDTVTFSGATSGSVIQQKETNPIVILTVILAIVFIVLLIVLIVLIGKKPEKTGEFGESYY
jgi:preprotein translocase subunit SecG